MSDEAEALRLFRDRVRMPGAVHPTTYYRWLAEFDAALASLESQNQALQEALRDAEQNIAMRQRHHNEEDLPEIKALQERAEKAERERDEARLAWTAANDRLLSLTCADLLSPTQETDPE